MITRLRLALSLSSIKRFFGADAVVPTPPADDGDITAILTQSGEFIQTQALDFLVRQFAGNEDVFGILLQADDQLLSTESDQFILRQAAPIQDGFGVELEDGSGFIITQNSEVIIRQLADKNIIIMQDGFELHTQQGGKLFITQDYLNLQKRNSDTELRDFLLTQSGEEMIIG